MGEMGNSYQRVQLPVIRWIHSEDLMCSIVPIVNNIVLYT